MNCESIEKLLLPIWKTDYQRMPDALCDKC